MSDTSQGPGWWIASDGRWYPPSAQPGPQEVQSVTGGVDVLHQDRPRKSQNGWYGLGVIVVVLGVLLAAPGTRHILIGSSSANGPGQSGVTVYSQPLTLTLASFTDPATDQSGYTTDGNSNDHYAVVKISATNNGNSTLPSSLPITITAFGSDGNAYEGGVETPTGDFLCSVGSDTALAPSETLTYCKGFVLPESVTVNRIEVSGNQGNGSGTANFNVSDTFSGWSDSSG